MGVGIAAIIDRSGKVYEMADATSSHERIRLTLGLAEDSVMAEQAPVYLMPVRPQDYFKAEKYKLYMSAARWQRRHGADTMYAASENERPTWFDDEMWWQTETALLRILERKLKARPIIVTEYLNLGGVADVTELPQLTVRHSCNIEGSTVERFAPGTEIYGDLQASRSALTPEGLVDVRIGTNRGTLWIEGLAQMTYLPDSLTVDGDELQVYMTEIRKPVEGRIMAAGSGLTWAGVPQHLRPRVRGIGE